MYQPFDAQMQASKNIRNPQRGVFGRPKPMPPQNLPKAMPAPSNLAKTPMRHENPALSNASSEQVKSNPILSSGGAAAKPRNTSTALMPKGASPAVTSIVNKMLEGKPKPVEEAMTELVPHYYGEVPGDPTLGRETNLCKLECHKCREEFADNIEFYAHMKVHLFDHHLSNMLMCRYCVLQFRDQQELDKHVHETHNPTARPLVCRLCMMNFNTPTLLINHMVDKHVQAELPYRCQVCNYASSYYTKLIDHFEEAHRGGPYVLCHFCLYVRTVAPSNADKLSHWVLAHLNEHTRSVRCGFCVLTLKNKARRSTDAHMVVHATYKNRKDVAPYPLAGCLLRVAGARLGRPSAARPLIVAHQDPQDKMRPLLAMSRRQRVLGDVKARVGAEDE